MNMHVLLNLDEVGMCVFTNESQSFVCVCLSVCLHSALLLAEHANRNISRDNKYTQMDPSTQAGGVPRFMCLGIFAATHNILHYIRFPLS